MPRTFASLGSFATFLGAVAIEADVQKEKALDRGAKIIQDEAKRVLGTYDYGWPKLSPDTINRKATGDSPGLETGEMQNSIQRNVTVGWFESVARIGSELDKALWFEIGTVHQPPRSFLLGAATTKSAEVAHEVGKHFVERTFKP